MADPMRRGVAAAVLLLALGLCALPLLGSAWAVAAWPAQVLMAIALASLAGRAAAPTLADTGRLLGLWGSAYLGLAVIVAWPLGALRDTGSLTAALALSGALGLALLVFWRVWPLFARAGHPGGNLLAASGEAADGRGESASGLVLALLMLATLAAGLALAWPGGLPVAWRLPVVLAQAALALTCHGLLLRAAGAGAGQALVAPAAATAALEVEGEGETPRRRFEGLPDERLYAATRAGQVEAAIAALAEGADPHAPPPAEERDQRTLPMLAAVLGDLRLLRELISRGIELNAEHAGLTPLLAATRDSWHGRPEAVMTLLANGADARRADGEGNTPLHHAARSTDPAVAALLIDAGAVVDALNQDGVSPLGIACAAGNWRLAKFLIEHGAKPEPRDGQPALLFAAASDDDPAGVQLLLRHKARVDARGAHQRSALLQACAAGNVEIVGALLDAGADRNARDETGLTPLLEAARGADAAVVARLAQARPDVGACDADGRNALCLACDAGAPPELVRHLIALGVNPEQRDNDGRRALEHALGAGRWPLVAVLDPAYPLPASVAESLSEGQLEKTPRALLRDALLADRLESAESLLRLGASPDPAGLASLLLEFAGDGDLPRLQWLLRHGASPDQRPEGGDSVIFRLLDRGGHALLALRRLLDHGQSVSGSGGLARFLAACLAGEQVSRGHEQFALELFERGADGFGAAAGEPPLALAVRLGWQRLAAALLAAGVDPNARDARGHAPLHLAAALGREESLRLLIRYGGHPGLSGPDGQTPLGLALAAGRRELSQWLEWRQWTLPGRPLQAADLPLAAMAGDVGAVRRLLDLGLPVDAVDGQGCSALLRAAGGGHDEVVALLLERGANAELAARTGATPLSAAISMRHVGVVERLLRAGAAPDWPLPGGITPLSLAAALGQPELVSRLLGHGADPSATDDQGLGALHCAALHAFTSRDRQRVLALVDTLLLAEVDPDLASASGHTPLLMLLGARAEPGTACDEDVILAVLERLLGEGVSVTAQDQRGLSPLHLAALHGLLRVVQRLLREGAERSARDALGRTPHDLALMRGFVDVAAEFEPTRPSPSLARFLRDKPPGG